MNISYFFYFLSELDKSAAVVGSSSIPSGVIFLGKGVKVESGLSSYSLLVRVSEVFLVNLYAVYFLSV